jgi:hypothetical protein
MKLYGVSTNIIDIELSEIPPWLLVEVMDLATDQNEAEVAKLNQTN